MIASLFTSFIATKLGKMIPPWAWELVFIALLIGAGMLVHHVQVVRHDNGVRAEQRAADQKALDQTVASYRAAASKAEAEDQAKNAHVQAQTASNDKDTIDELQARLAAARAEYQRLRSARPANPGSPAKPGVPVLPPPASGPDETACQDGLHGPDALTATEQAIQLDELEKWVTRQHAIDPNATGAPH